jgi:hypothetical protein
MICRYQIPGFIATSTLLISMTLGSDSQTGSLQQPWIKDYLLYCGGSFANLIANQLVKGKKPNNMGNNSILWVALVSLLSRLLV